MLKTASLGSMRLLRGSQHESMSQATLWFKVPDLLLDQCFSSGCSWQTNTNQSLRSPLAFLLAELSRLAPYLSIKRCWAFGQDTRGPPGLRINHLSRANEALHALEELWLQDCSVFSWASLSVWAGRLRSCPPSSRSSLFSPNWASREHPAPSSWPIG